MYVHLNLSREVNIMRSAHTVGGFRLNKNFKGLLRISASGICYKYNAIPCLIALVSKENPLAETCDNYPEWRLQVKTCYDFLSFCLSEMISLHISIFVPPLSKFVSTQHYTFVMHHVSLFEGFVVYKSIIHRFSSSLSSLRKKCVGTHKELYVLCILMQ
jgi:hypothetical protein